MEELQQIFKDNNIYYNILCFFISENKKFYDRNESKLYWRTVLHMYSIYHHISICLYAMSLNLEKYDFEQVITLRTFKVFYLTGWNFTFQTIFLLLSLIYDLMEWADKTQTDIAKKISFLRDVVFNGLVVPFTLFVTGMFWIIYWIDRELVFPSVFDEIVPWWFNHCVHTNILIVVAIETLLQPRRHPRSLKVETVLYCTVTFGYAIVYYSIYFIAHRWLYDVFGAMTWWQVCLFQIGIWISSHIFYRIQFPINRLFHKKNNLDNQTQSVEFLHEKAINDFGEIVRENSYPNIIDDGEKKLSKNVHMHLEGRVNGSFNDKHSGREKHISFEEDKRNKDNEKAFEDDKLTTGTDILLNDVKVAANKEHLEYNADKLAIYVENIENGNTFSHNAISRSVLDINDVHEDHLDSAFEKSWSLKYRSVRNEPDNSSL